jgi:hypothetical protein
MKIFSAVFACGVLLLVADAAIQAQTAAAAGAAPAPGVTAAPAVIPAPAVTPKDIGPIEAWSDKPLGKYDIVINIPEGAMPVEITISESASGLSALFYKVGDNDAHVMDAAVNGTDLVLKGVTPHGALTMQIRHHGAKLSGIWQLGEGRGTLEGSVLTT